MDESLQEFEVELKALAPRRVAPRLMEHIANELATPAGEPSDSQKNDAPLGIYFIAWRWMSVGAVGIAAALAILVAVNRRHDHGASAALSVPGSDAKMSAARNPLPTERPDSGNAYKPVAAANVLYEMKDEGLVPTTGDNAERRVRYRYVDTYTWKNPRNNASLTWSVPRDEIRVQPIQFN